MVQEAVFSVWNVLPMFWGKNAAKSNKIIYHSYYERGTGIWFFRLRTEDTYLNILELVERFGAAVFDRDSKILFEDWFPKRNHLYLTRSAAEAGYLQRQTEMTYQPQDAGASQSAFSHYIATLGSQGQKFLRNRRNGFSDLPDDRSPEYDEVIHEEDIPTVDDEEENVF